MDRLELFNKAAKVVKPAHTDHEAIPDQDMPLVDSGLDSLDLLMISVFLCEVFGISEEIAKQMKFTTVREYMDFCDKHKTRDFATADEAIAEVNW